MQLVERPADGVLRQAGAGRKRTYRRVARCAACLGLVEGGFEEEFFEDDPGVRTDPSAKVAARRSNDEQHRSARLRRRLQKRQDRRLRDPFRLDADLDVRQPDRTATRPPQAGEFVSLTAADPQYTGGFLDRQEVGEIINTHDATIPM